ncbi:hypothetical protein, partial [Nocardioides panacisoli]|uniref:hypothetical protein n=1 Tax=Nocardioides panacisoli TaxID=627624 RepID=UPI0031DC6712
MTSPGATDTAATAVQAAQGLSEIPWDQVEGPDAIEIAAGLGKLKALIDGALVALAERIEATDA